MNNSFLGLDYSSKPEQDEKILEALREKESSLVRIIEAIGRVERSADWSSLKTDVFDGLAQNLRNRIFTEAKKEQPDSLKLNRLSGQLEWADRFADLSKFRKEKEVELKSVKKQLYGKEE